MCGNAVNLKVHFGGSISSIKGTVMSRLFFLLFLLFCSSSVIADYPLEIIQLQSRPTAEMIPILRPFIDKDGSIAGMNDQLIIRTSPANLVEIRKVIQRLDHPPRRLMISVRQATGHQLNQRRTQADINLVVGKHAKVVVGNPGNDNTVRYQIRDSQTKSNLDATHRLQVLEGHSAFITTGQSVPVPEQTTTINNNTIHQQITTRYKNVTSGFYVIPRLNGEQVTLEISPHMIRPGNRQENYDIQQAQTMVSGKLGEWIAIGGINQQVRQANQGLLRETQTNNRDDRSIELLVEEITQ
ncbi:MAG: hypothetical protein FHK78_10695 [Sedimenticola selenatireducens]|uniref:Type II/III secretion system secretin-like domain-containing protein n=2 Tax=Sedimenticola selenatireducens TaxID=191960 RepID=A0A558DRW1_9GAMM|nr:hypothetical protein FHP88_07995 [Sedimenticola selenatireducens]TVT63791.1 MAG: hypothetical protein FHK78_10695 [Sedimenticola selenatireducens]